MTQLQWVKASTRFPTKDGHYFIKWDGLNSASYIVVHAIDKKVWLERNAQWLEEIESPSSIEGEEKKAYLEWLDEQIKKCEYGKLHFDWHSHNTSLQCFKEAREKFLSVESPSPALPIKEEEKEGGAPVEQDKNKTKDHG